jgi:hypothetical protein
MIQRLAAFACSLDENREIGAGLLLTDELRQVLRAQRGIACIFIAARRRDDAGGTGHVRMRGYSTRGESSSIEASRRLLPDASRACPNCVN